MSLLNQSAIDPNRGRTLLGVSTIDQSTIYPISGIPLASNTIFALTTAIVDSSGVQITSFGGGTQYTDGNAAAAHPIGTGMIFNNAGTYTFVSAAHPLPVTGGSTQYTTGSAQASPVGNVALGYDGTSVKALPLDASGYLEVDIKAGGGTGGTAIADKSAFTTGTTNFTPVGGIYQSSVDTVTTGNAAALAIDANRNVQTVGNIASGATDAGSPVKVGGVYNASAPTLTNGQRGDLQLDSNANLKVNLATAISGEDATANRLLVEQRNSYSYISTATTTTIKSSQGFFHTMTVQGGTAGTIIIYDNTAGSGTIIASFDSTNAIATYEFDVLFSTGLTVVTSAATKLTVSYR